MDRQPRVTLEQQGAMLDFMERHGDLLRTQGAGSQGRLRADHLWKELVVTLNDLGDRFSLTQSHKPSEKWKKVWADWKAKTKKKALRLRYCNDREQKELSSLEKRVLAVMGISTDLEKIDIEQSDNEQNGLSPTQSSETSTYILSTGLSPEMNGVDAKIEAPSSPPSPLDLVQPIRLERVFHQRSPTPMSQESTQSQPLIKMRRKLKRTSFSIAARKLASVQVRRVRLEELQERNHHRREIFRLRLENRRLRMENRRIEVDQEHNDLLRRLADIAQTWLEHSVRRNE